MIGRRLVREQYRDEFYMRFSKLEPALQKVVEIFCSYELPPEWDIYWSGGSAAYAIGQTNSFSGGVDIFIVGRAENQMHQEVIRQFRNLSRHLRSYHDFHQKYSRILRSACSANGILAKEIICGDDMEPLNLQIFLTTEFVRFDLIECMVVVPLINHLSERPIIYMDLCECHQINHDNKSWKIIPYFKWGQLDSCNPYWIASSIENIFKKKMNNRPTQKFLRPWYDSNSIKRFLKYNQRILDKKYYHINFLSPYCMKCIHRDKMILHNFFSWWYYKTYCYNSKLVSRHENEFYGYSYSKRVSEECKTLSKIITYWHFITYHRLDSKIVHKKNPFFK